jgi:beta-N-acetylglucosaminidase
VSQPCFLAYSGVEIDGKKYYNFYGVGALDKDPVKTGAEYAKKHGWELMFTRILRIPSHTV